jgi:hypothetical protein
MLEPCDVCGEATERGTCDDCRQADRSQHKTARAKAILDVLNGPPHEPRFAEGGAFDFAGTDCIDRENADWIDRAYRQQRRD